MGFIYSGAVSYRLNATADAVSGRQRQMAAQHAFVSGQKPSIALKSQAPDSFSKAALTFGVKPSEIPDNDPEFAAELKAFEKALGTPKSTEVAAIRKRIADKRTPPVSRSSVKGGAKGATGKKK